MSLRATPASRSRKLSVPSTSSSGSPAEKPSASMRSVAGSRYTLSASRQDSGAVGEGAEVASAAEGGDIEGAIGVAAYYSRMCSRCELSIGPWPARRTFLALAGAAAVTPALAQVEVGKASVARNLVPADTIEQAGVQQYDQLLQQAKAKGALAPDGHPQLQRLRAISARLIPF